MMGNGTNCVVEELNNCNRSGCYGFVQARPVAAESVFDLKSHTDTAVSNNFVRRASLKLKFSSSLFFSPLLVTWYRQSSRLKLRRHLMSGPCEETLRRMKVSYIHKRVAMQSKKSVQLQRRARRTRFLGTAVTIGLFVTELYSDKLVQIS